MKKLLNTLYVTTQGAYLSKEGETITAKVDGEVVLRLPVHTLGSIVCFGQVSCSPYLMGFCAENQVAISFLTEHGDFLAKVQGPVTGNVLLRREQYRRADNLQASASIARAVLTGKIANCRAVLQRALRDHSARLDADALIQASQKLASSLRRLQIESPLDIIRGIEGESANVYFEVFNHLITAQKDYFKFIDRNRRPPLDNVNCLLSFTYVLLMHDTRSALETVGLDPAVGFLHRDRPGRYGLALDIMEEFRSYIADRLSLSLINLGQVQAKGFKKKETGAVWMDDDTRKTVLVAYQKRKQEEIEHPYLKERVAVGLLPYVQALLMARYLRGDMDNYPPFIWK
jgi:CRISPR-associated protein Cas1